MILISDYDDVTGLNRVLIISFTFGLIVGAFIVAGFSAARRQGSEVKQSRSYSAGIALFATLIGLGRLILLYHDYFAPDLFDDPLWRLGSAIALGGLTTLAFTIESFIFTKTKRIS